MVFDVAHGQRLRMVRRSRLEDLVDACSLSSLLVLRTRATSRLPIVCGRLRVGRRATGCTNNLGRAGNMRCLATANRGPGRHHGDSRSVLFYCWLFNWGGISAGRRCATRRNLGEFTGSAVTAAQPLAEPPHHRQLLTQVRTSYRAGSLGWALPVPGCILSNVDLERHADGKTSRSNFVARQCGWGPGPRDYPGDSVRSPAARCLDTAGTRVADRSDFSRRGIRGHRE